MNKTEKKQQTLSVRQKALIDELAAGTTDISAALQKHRISKQLYRQWLKLPEFAGELLFQRDCGFAQSRMILARFAPAAAARLVALTESDKEETVRKACLDIITLSGKLELPGRDDENGDSEESAADTAGTVGPDISPETAAKILELLAQEGDCEQKVQADRSL